MKKSLSSFLVAALILAVFMLILKGATFDKEIGVSVYRVIRLYETEYPDLTVTINDCMEDGKIDTGEEMRIYRKYRELEREEYKKHWRK